MLTFTTKTKLERLLEEKVIHIKRGEDRKETIRLSVQRTADGNLLVDDNLPFYIYIIPTKATIFSAPKDLQDELIIPKQRKFFDYLVKKGITLPGNVGGGEVFNSFEAKYALPEDQENGVLGNILKRISEYVQEEAIDGKVSADYVKNRLKYLVGGQNGSTDMEKIGKNEKDFMTKSGYYAFGRSTIRDIPAYSSYYFE